MDIREVLLQLRSTQSNRAVARATGTDRRTVQRYRKWASQHNLLDATRPLPPIEELQSLLNQTLPSKPPPQNVSSVEGYRSLVEQWHQCGVEGTAIWQRLAEQGYTGTLSSVYRFLRRLDPPQPGANATVRVERGAGEEAQVDFGYVGFMLDPTTGVARKTWAFVMTLSYSRHQYVEFVFDQSIGTWLSLHRHALEFFGGVPQRIVTDNLKSAVTKVYWDGTDPQLQASYRECAEHYGFLISPCRPRTPQHKGKVESGVHYLKRNFCGGRTPTSLTQANADVRQWCQTTAGQRNHGTTHHSPLVVFEEVERAALKPLPTSPYDLSVWKEVRLHRDCYVVFENAFYSAPFRLIGHKLRVRAGSTSVRLYNSSYELIATHTRASGPGERVTHQDHLPPYKLAGLNRNRPQVQEQADQLGPATGGVVRAMLSDPALDRLGTAARVVHLSRQFGDSRLEAACGRALAFGETDYKTIKGILVAGLDRAEDAAEIHTNTSRVNDKSGPGTRLTTPNEVPPAVEMVVGSPALASTSTSTRLFARSAEELLGHLFSPVASLAGAVVLGGLGLMWLSRLGSGVGGGTLWN